MIQGKNTDCIDVLLDPGTAPSPVVARGWDMHEAISFCHRYCHLQSSSCHYSHVYHVTYSREGVTHWVLSAGHPLLLFWKQVILPHLEKRVLRKTKGTCWLKVKVRIEHGHCQYWWSRKKSRKWKYDEWTNYINSDSDLLIESEIMNWTLRRIWTLFDIEVESEQIT